MTDVDLGDFRDRLTRLEVEFSAHRDASTEFRQSVLERLKGLEDGVASVGREISAARDGAYKIAIIAVIALSGGSIGSSMLAQAIFPGLAPAVTVNATASPPPSDAP